MAATIVFRHSHALQNASQLVDLLRQSCACGELAVECIGDDDEMLDNCLEVTFPREQPFDLLLADRLEQVLTDAWHM